MYNSQQNNRKGSKANNISKDGSIFVTDRFRKSFNLGFYENKSSRNLPHHRIVLNLKDLKDNIDNMIIAVSDKGWISLLLNRNLSVPHGNHQSFAGRHGYQGLNGKDGSLFASKAGYDNINLGYMELGARKNMSFDRLVININDLETAINEGYISIAPNGWIDILMSDEGEITQEIPKNHPFSSNPAIPNFTQKENNAHQANNRSSNNLRTLPNNIVATNMITVIND